MQVSVTNISSTKVKLAISAGVDELSPFKQAVLTRLSKEVKLAGFRPGKAPLNLVEKNVDQTVLQREFLDEAMTALYSHAAAREKIRPVGKPEVNVKKFVPFSQLEFEITTDVVGKAKLADYKNIKLEKPDPEVSAQDINDVLESLQQRTADKSEVSRPIKKSDEVVIDFRGVDEKGAPINGAEGKDYPLAIGSNTFIPGFEDNLVGLKPGDEKTFDLTFPKDYSVKALAGKKVRFSVNIKNVHGLTKPPLDDDFASKVGPFKTLKDLKADVKKQLTNEKQAQANKEYANKLVEKISEKSSVAIPESMIEHQISHNLEDVKRNIAYRGQTLQEYLKMENTTEERYRNEVLRPQAELQIKGSIILSEIADAEGLSVTPEELEVRMQILKGQYKDQQMQTELDKPEAREDVASRMLTDKVLARLEEYATGK
ncbi:MAG TPA: trigger factor [Candidatus Saccharimonadales bacterium]|nr:trigger factor [Candidatus Saccharimonadales bacterium]